MHIEDQALTAKGCRRLSAVKVMLPETMLQHIRAVLRARRNDSSLIIARTDAGCSLGL